MLRTHFQRRRACTWLAAAGALVAASSLHAQPAPEADASFDLRPEPDPKPALAPPSERFGLAALDPVPLVVAPPADIARARAEDAARAAAGDRSRRIGVPLDLWLSPAMGRWDAVPGGRIWRAAITSPGADGLRVHFSQVNLIPGAELWVIAAPEATQAFGPLEPRGRADEGLWAPTCFSTDTVRIEYFEPDAALKPGEAAPALPFLVDQVQHVYRDPAVVAAEVNGLSARVGSCHLDVTCHPAWASVAQAVAGIGAIGQTGFLFCTGQLISTTAGDLTPYFLTANHCVANQSEASTTEVYWRYQTSVCNGTVPALSTLTRSGPCTMLATGTAFSSSDFALLMIEGRLPSGLSWVGWTSATQPSGTAAACVQHPDGSWKRICFGNRVSGSACGGSNYHRLDWTQGVTEPGSSGSGIFRTSDQRLFGQLYCGFSDCSTPFLDDDFGRFDVSYPALATFLAEGSDDSLEHNDDCSAATTAAPTPPGTYSSLIVKSIDEDWYRFTLQPGERLTLTLTFTHAWGDVDLQLFGVCGGSVLASSTTTSGSEMITYTNAGAAAADVLARVYLFNDTRNGYTMTVAITPTLPANDACASATPLQLDTPATGTTLAATSDGSAGCGATGGVNTGPDVWYTFTPPCTATYRFDTAGSTFDTVLSLHTGCVGTTGNQVACNDDVAPPTDRTSLIEVPLTAGTTYRLRLAGYNVATGAYTVRVTLPPPANNNCADAAPVSEGATPFSTCGATTDGPSEPSACSGFGDSHYRNDVWFLYTPACTGIATVAACGGASFDTKVAIYDAGACPTAGGSVIACNDDAPGCGTLSRGSRVEFPAQAGAAYLIRVGGYNGATGSSILDIACQPSAVLGACCTGTVCTTVTQSDCTLAVGAAFQGDNTVCGAAGNPTTCCPANFNQTGGITVQDIFDYLAAYFGNAPGADFNNSGSISVQDIFDFLAAYFMGC